MKAIFVSVDGSGPLTNKYVSHAKERYNEILHDVFSSFICSEVERIGGDGLLSCLSFIIVKELCGQIGSCMERNG